MTGRILRRPRALLDLEEQIRYIAADNPEAAVRYEAAVEATLTLLASMPLMGPEAGATSRRLEGLRFFPVAGFATYLVFYLPLPDSEGVDVIRVLHAARDRDRLLGP